MQERSEFQLELSEDELSKLAAQIDYDFRGANADHEKRLERFRGYYQKWRNRVDPPAPGDEEASNFSVPLVQWNTFSKMATTMQALFGDDAEVVAVPVAPSDERLVKKIGRYMTWRMFDSMNCVSKFGPFVFWLTLCGRAFAAAPWVQETFLKKGEDGKITHEVWYDGPGFEPLWPDELIVPAEDATNLQDFSFVVHQQRLTPDQLLDAERQGKLFGITENFDQFVNLASLRRQRNWEAEQIKREKDLDEGITYEGSLANRGTIQVYKWFGKWRLPVDPKQSPDLNDIKARELYQRDILVWYFPELHQVYGVQDLMELYPNMKDRRPFVEASLVKDGSYWSAGFGELLDSIDDEVSVNHNLFTEAGQFTVGPVIFYKPGVGYNPKTMKYEPGQAIPCDDPNSVKAIQIQPELGYVVAKEQSVMSYGERVTGVSDQTLGRAIDRPNAPRTASGQLALIEQGNVRASLDTMMLREDIRKIINHIWQLDTEFSPPSVFFRVTDDDANELFATKNGFGEMTAEERGGRYDFDLRFATSVWSREAKKQNQMQLYGLDMQNPLVVQNPRALWVITNGIHAAMGDDNFRDILPEPPDLGMPKNPKEEWALMLKGEDTPVNPLDNDDLHLQDHYKRAMDARTDPDKDQDAVNRLAAHILEHLDQKRKKMIAQAITAQLAQQLGQMSGVQGMGALAGMQQQPQPAQPQPPPQAPQRFPQGPQSPASPMELPSQNGGGGVRAPVI